MTTSALTNDYYNFSHTIEQEIELPRSIVIWNMLDFGHVNFVHKRSYHHCKVLAKEGHATFLEYGVHHLIGFPWHVNYVMWHQFTPPGTITHLSRGPLGSFSKVIVSITERRIPGTDKVKTHIEHAFHLRLPFFLQPFGGLVRRYLQWWSDVLWEEDYGMMLRRDKVLNSGFCDKNFDTVPRAPEGLWDRHSAAVNE